MAALFAMHGGARAQATPSLAVSAPPPPVIEARLISYDVRLNGRPLGTWTLLQRGGTLYAPVADVPAWGIRPRANVFVREEQGRIWYPLTSIEGAELRVTPNENRLDLLVPPTALLPAGSRLPALPTPSTSTVIPAPGPAATPGGQNFLPLDVVINGSRAGNWLLLEQKGTLYAPAEAFDEWRLTRSERVAPLEARGQRWYSLSAVPGFQSTIDAASQTVQLRFSPQAFTATRVASEAVQRPALSRAIPAAFLNYDLNLTAQSARGAPDTREYGALLELGASNHLGVLTSSFVASGLSGSPSYSGSKWRRLETSLTRDLPDSNVTVRLGDGTTRAGIGGRAVYFGGVQVARNFALTPGFVTQPIPIVTGVSSAPSTVELYINDTLRQTSRVPAGPFQIENVNSLSGSGQARVVVRDLLGRETVLEQDFFTHSWLLEKGLSDWSLEAGAVRRNLAQDNANYGQSFVSGLYRYGTSQQQTVETKAELGEDTKGLTLALTRALSPQILSQVSLAYSRDAVAGSGTQATLGLEHRSLRHGFSARIESATAGFRQLGYTTSFLPPRLVAAFSYNYTHPAWGTLGLAYAHSDIPAAGALNSYTLNYTARVGASSSLMVALTRVTGASHGTAVSVSFVAPLGDKWTSSSTLSSRDGITDASTMLVIPLAQETGLGGRAIAGTRAGRSYTEGGLYYQGSRGLATADLSVSERQQALRLGASGGLAVADGQFFASRKIEDSFAVVEVPGYADIGVGFQGGTLARTNAEGIAILPRLRPYDSNSIRLDPRELPISAELDTIEQVAVPASRSAVKVTFPVRSGRGALVRLVLDNGEPVPPGAEVELVGDKKEFFVARRGEAFITGLQDRNTIRVRHGGGACTVSVALPPANPDEIVRIGPLTCHGVAP